MTRTETLIEAELERLGVGFFSQQSGVGILDVDDTPPGCVTMGDDDDAVHCDPEAVLRGLRACTRSSDDPRWGMDEAWHVLTESEVAS